MHIVDSNQVIVEQHMATEGSLRDMLYGVIAQSLPFKLCDGDVAGEI